MKSRQIGGVVFGERGGSNEPNELPLDLPLYEVLDCELLHDIKGHLLNLLPEIPLILPPPLKEVCWQILETTLPKGTVCGAPAAIKLLLKLQACADVDPQVLMLLTAIVQHYWRCLSKIS